MESDGNVPAAVLAEYGAQGSLIEQLTGGRTNRTLRVRAGRELVLQQLRADPETDLLAVMENLVRVTSHLDWKQRIDADSPGDKTTAWWPELILTQSGKPFLVQDGDVWRAFGYRKGRIARSQLPASTLVSVAALFGSFSRFTADLGGPDLLVTTARFHDLDDVWSTFEQHLGHAPAGRVAELADQIDRLRSMYRRVTQAVTSDGLDTVPNRVVHNDTKLSNVLLHETTSDAVAVLDLDLVMMGPIWHDVGDMIRSMAWHCGPGDPAMSLSLFDAVTASFVRTAGPTLSDDEIATFAVAGPRLSFELGVRYLCDHLRDDPVLRVEGPNGHLLRGLSNVKLAEEMLTAYDALRSVVDDLIGRR